MRKILVLLLTVALMVSAFGCNQPAPTPTPTPDPVEDKGWSSEHYKESMKGTVLNMYAVTDSIIPALELFYEDTGIKVESLTLKNGEMLQRIENEKLSGKVLADLWFTGGADAFIVGAEKGLTMAYKSPQAEELAADMKDAEGHWTGTSLTVVNWVVNKKVLAELGAEMPTKWDDLLQPELKGMVSMSDPASSGTAYNTITAILQTRGTEKGWEYFDKLIEQVPFFTPRGSDPTTMTQAGEAAVGIAAGTGKAEMGGDDPNVILVYPEDGTGWWPQPLAILEGCAHPDAAKVFVDWALSPRGLEEIGKCQNALTVKADVPAPEGILSLEDIELFPTDFKANAKDRDAILAIWTEKTTK